MEAETCNGVGSGKSRAGCPAPGIDAHYKFPQIVFFLMSQTRRKGESREQRDPLLGNLCFFRSFARKKWPLRGSEKPEIPPTPLCKGGQGGIYREYTGFFLFTPAKGGIGISLALSAHIRNGSFELAQNWIF